MKSKNKVVSKNNTKRLLLDVADIMKNPLTEQGIHYIHDEGNMFKGTAMIIGPSDTPYADGFYFFKFKFPKEYPFKPPTLTYCTNDGTTRFNPNLYRNGKVTSCQSIRSILLTLVTLLNENPLTNEPGFPATHRSCMPYKRMIEYMNFKISILGMLNKGSLQPKFSTYYPILKKYFMENKNQIMERITELEKSDYNLKEDRISVYNMCVKYDYKDLKSKFEEQIKVLE